jgi:hypothetical protein
MPVPEGAITTTAINNPQPPEVKPEENKEDKDK